MNVSEWVLTRISQIASLSKLDGGGEDKENIDSNAEFSCLAKLLANCTEDKDKKFINAKMKEYLKGAQKEHFECDSGRSYDEVYDSTGNRMYVCYDQYADIDNINTTLKNDDGEEVPYEYIYLNKDGSIFTKRKNM